jgi:tol-pal system protein YbgF
MRQINKMKRRLIAVAISFFICSLSFSAAPVEEAQEYLSQEKQVALKGAEQEGFTVETQSKESVNDTPDQEASHKEVEDEDSSVLKNQDVKEDLAPARSSSAASMSSEGRFFDLNQQVHHLTQLNLPAKMNEMQQEIAHLTAQLQDQDRRIKNLQSQQENLYEKIHGQMKRLENQAPILTKEDKKDASSMEGSMTSVDVERPIGPTSTRAKVSDTEAYQAAFTQLMNKEYASARQGFSRYLQDYPEGKYSGNVNYWLGEIALIEKRYSQAEAAFSAVVTRYPDSGKLADANYKLAITHLKMGQDGKARVELAFVEKQYAGKTIARLAKLQLEQLG